MHPCRPRAGCLRACQGRQERQQGAPPNAGLSVLAVTHGPGARGCAGPPRVRRRRNAQPPPGGRAHAAPFRLSPWPGHFAYEPIRPAAWPPAALPSGGAPFRPPRARLRATVAEACERRLGARPVPSVRADPPPGRPGGPRRRWPHGSSMRLARDPREPRPPRPPPGPHPQGVGRRRVPPASPDEARPRPARPRLPPAPAGATGPRKVPPRPCRDRAERPGSGPKQWDRACAASRPVPPPSPCPRRAAAWPERCARP